MTKKLPSIYLLRQLLRYDPDTGQLFWVPRTHAMFSATLGRTSQHSCSHWNSRYAGHEAFTSDNGDGYKQGRIFGAAFFAHRVAYALATGFWPSHEIDHIDGDRSNNRLPNLRLASRSENQCNTRMPKNNNSGVKGVSWSSKDKRWVAQIAISGRRVAYKCFADFDQAKQYADTERMRAHKEFARFE